MPPMRPPILFPLFAPVTSLKGVGPRVAPLLESLAGPRVIDVLTLPPQGLIRRTRVLIAEALDGANHILEATIVAHEPPTRPRQPWRIVVEDAGARLKLVYFRGFGPHLARDHPPGRRRLISGRVERDRFESTPQIVHPDHLSPLDRAEGISTLETVYPAVAGLPSRLVRRFALEALARAPVLEEWQDEAWVRKNGWSSWRDALERLHHPTTETDLEPGSPHRRRLAFDELLAHQLALARRKAERRRQPAPVIGSSSAAGRIEDALPFRLTGAQIRALGEIRSDLASGDRMSRLLQGDVGSGKTVVAMLAMADAAAVGLQGALMAPTEILARQHFDTLAAPLARAGVRAVLLTGRDKGSVRDGKLAEIASGRAGLVVGTHALFQDEVAFANLALAVIDEQHRFGVSERARLLSKGPGVHLLAMSATPIPRTLELTMYGDLDVSRIDEKPAGRRPVATRAAPSTRIGDVVERLNAAVKSGAQAFWICPLIAESADLDVAAAEARRDSLKPVFGDRVGLIHGRLASAEKDAVMADFVEGRVSVLVATTVVEVGVNVPAASIMIVEQAERFGLAQLHQLRGRVGRGDKESSCVLLYDPPLSHIATRRLDILRQTEDGFALAEADLALRGGGDPLGLRQSGFPAYRLADPARHQDLILAAADDARLVLARDPDLTSPRGRALGLLQALFDWSPAAAVNEA
jgi:ATP-dependent DNA helicase RecG